MGRISRGSPAQVTDDFFLVPNVVTRSEYVDPARKELVGDIRCDTESGRRVFYVRDDQIEILLLAELGQTLLQDLSTGFAYDVSSEEDSSRRYRPTPASGKE